MEPHPPRRKLNPLQELEPFTEAQTLDGAGPFAWLVLHLLRCRGTPHPTPTPPNPATRRQTPLRSPAAHPVPVQAHDLDRAPAAAAAAVAADAAAAAGSGAARRDAGGFQEFLVRHLDTGPDGLCSGQPDHVR